MKNKQTHTEIVFMVKDEPVLDSIQKEFKGKSYTVTSNELGRYTKLTLNVNTIIPISDHDLIKLDGWDTQFESIKYY